MHRLVIIAMVLFVGIFGENNDDSIQQVELETVSTGNISVSTNVTEEKNDENSTDFVWLMDAIKDVAYYLRNHKFNEYDRRYETKKSDKYKYYAEYPKPPLRSLHWEVNKFCEPSFISCMEFLNKKVKLTLLRKQDDTSSIVYEQNWYNESEQIAATDQDCQSLRDKDDLYAVPFQGAIEKFQWRTTASYYLCWYAMNGVPELEHFHEPCDNFANCLDAEFGARNQDPRANDTESFACILYSVCPDPCCPIRHISAFNECWNNEANPCYHPDYTNRKCAFERERNKDFTDIVLNHWNVTCKCNKPGFIWESRYGICVDINECATGNHTCIEDTEVCLNLPGSYRCVCNWGHILKAGKCVVSEAIPLLKLERGPDVKVADESHAKSLIKWILKKIALKLNI